MRKKLFSLFALLLMVVTGAWADEDMKTVPLTLEAKTAGTIVVKYPQSGMQYSLNGGDKTAVTTTAINVAEGDIVQFFGSGTSITSYYDTTTETGTQIVGGDAECYIYGNIMSLVDETEFSTADALTGASAFRALFVSNKKIFNHDSKKLLLPATTLADYCYCEMFYKCSKLTAAPELPATTLAEGCYGDMFSNCTGLTAAPALPATTMKDYCYYNMFNGCSNLTTAPALPATTLASFCYQDMFYGCTGLTTAPELPATSLADQCYSWMFSNCSNLTTAPALPATTLAEGCYESMFYGCTGLTSAPALPATTLAEGCYNQMFRGCTGLTNVPTDYLPVTTLALSCYRSMFYNCSNLTTAPELPAETLANYCYSQMFYNCTGLTTAPALPATTLAAGCYNAMFRGCTGLTAAPILPATTLAYYCYSQMFYNCSMLNSVTCLATDISATAATTNWLYGVSSTGTFTKAKGFEGWSSDNTSGIPSGWTRQNYVKTLNEAEDNSSWITTNNGKTFDVKLTRTLSSGSYNTFAAPFSMDIPTDWTVKELTSSSFAGGVLTLIFSNAGSIVAGKPYLVKVSENVANPTFEGVTISSTTTPTETTAVIFVPTLGKTLVTGYGTDAGNAKTVLFLGAGNKLYNPTVVNDSEQDASYMKGFRAYFQLKGEAAQAPVQSLVMNFSEGATGIISATLNDSAEGTNGEYYDLQGRRIEGQPTLKGVYIVNGKKVIK